MDENLEVRLARVVKRKKNRDQRIAEEERLRIKRKEEEDQRANQALLVWPNIQMRIERLVESINGNLTGSEMELLFEVKQGANRDIAWGTLSMCVDKSAQQVARLNVNRFGLCKVSDRYRACLYSSGFSDFDEKKLAEALIKIVEDTPMN